MTREGDNTREFTRVEVSVRAELKAAGRTLAGAPTHSISMKAISLQTPERLPVGTECEIRLILVDGDVEIKAAGTVLKELPDGMVVQFTRLIGLESYEHLRNLVFYNSRDVEQVEDEFSSHSGIRRKDPN